MKLLLSALTLISFSAAANPPETTHEDRVKLVAANKYTCGERSMFTLKEFSGDSVSGYAYFTFFLPTRHSYKVLDCPALLKRMWQEGNPEIFTFLGHVKEIYRPTQLGALAAFPTKLSTEDQQKVKSVLEKFSVNFSSPWYRLGGYLRDVVFWIEDEVLAQRLELALQAANELDRIMEEYSDAFDGEWRNLLKESLQIELNLKGFHSRREPREKSLAAARRLNDRLVLIHSIILNARTSTDLTVIHLLHLLGRGESLENFRAYGQYQLGAILAQPDEKLRLSDLKAFQRHLRDYSRSYLGNPFGDRPRHGRGVWENPSIFECKLLVGELVRTGNQEMRDLVVQTYNGLSCSEWTSTYNVNPAKYHDIGYASNPEEYFSDKKYVELAPEIERRAGDCAQTPFVKAVLSLERDRRGFFDYFPLARTALASKCRANAELFVEQSIKTGRAMKELRQLTDGDEHAWDRQLVRILLSKLNGQLNQEDAAIIERKYGRSMTREIRIQKRQQNEMAREILIASNAHDTDDAINLNWNGLTIELNEQELNPTQQKFVDATRMAQMPEEVTFALVRAFADLQAENRQLRRNERLELEYSFEEFLKAKPADLTTAVPAAKKYLDEVLEKSGETKNYNLTATSVFDVVLNGRMQCASGTDFMLLHTARADGLSYGDKYAVAIMKPGHVLPGLADAKASTVEGIESTVQGRGRVALTLTGKSLPANTRVILAEDYLMTKVLSSAFKNSAATMGALMSRAEKVLNIKQGKIDEEKPAAAGEGQPSGDGLNTSIFAFGRVVVPAGDLQRANMDSVPGDADAARLAELGQPRNEPAGGLSRFPEVRSAEDGEAQPAPEGAIMARELRPEHILHISAPSIQPEEHLLSAIARELRAGLEARARRDDSENEHFYVMGAIRASLSLNPQFRNALLRAVRESMYVAVDLGLPTSERQQQVMSMYGHSFGEAPNAAAFNLYPPQASRGLDIRCCVNGFFRFSELEQPEEGERALYFGHRRAPAPREIVIKVGLAEAPGTPISKIIQFVVTQSGELAKVKSVIAPVLGLQLRATEPQPQAPAQRY